MAICLFFSRILLGSKPSKFFTSLSDVRELLFFQPRLLFTPLKTRFGFLDQHNDRGLETQQNCKFALRKRELAKSWGVSAGLKPWDAWRLIKKTLGPSKKLCSWFLAWTQASKYPVYLNFLNFWRCVPKLLWLKNYGVLLNFIFLVSSVVFSCVTGFFASLKSMDSVKVFCFLRPRSGDITPRPQQKKS